MSIGQSSELTQLLVAWSHGDEAALQALTPIVYDELRRLARGYMRQESPGHTLQSTAVVHEAFLRMFGQHVEWQCRAQFFGIAAQMMRRILVDHARSQGSIKRGSGMQQITLDDRLSRTPEKIVDIIALDEALERLARVDPRRSRIVELRYFGGLTNDEIASVLGISAATIQRQWCGARVWLFHELSGQEPA